MRWAFFRTLLLFVAFPFWFSFIIGHHRVGRKKTQNNPNEEK
jgi:hypothetical protein